MGLADLVAHLERIGMSFEFIYQPEAEHKCDFPRYDTVAYGAIIQCRECQRHYTLITGMYGPIWSEVSRFRHPFLYRRLKNELP